MTGKKTLLKGGSLAGTYLLESPDSSFRCVRKEISTTENREYGYQRWYSQMKRMQRYESLFPGLFPMLLGCGVDDESGYAYFDMEFLENAENCHDYICDTTSPEQVEKVFEEIISAMQEIHSIELPSSCAALSLYILEEIEQKLHDCMDDEEFKSFYNYESIVFNGSTIPSLGALMSDYVRKGNSLYKKASECLTHGNITLENLMYAPLQNRIYFIDPYEENIIDNHYNEYSQILQSCHSHYELYNQTTTTRRGNQLECQIEVPYGIHYFNTLFNDYMKQTLSRDEIQLVKFFEVSQFIRMLPFKLHVDKEKMFFFYGMASSLANQFLNEETEI
tara:strand:+ start:21486 stop:22487 length:1002 start_codon:yes stop_codon:yes gene_type:complete